ncbi:MAG: hypothetical protein H0X26_02365 [Alphaproteobacteria bacterium]|nr:hypothetical protein [Alphaproteobacteria bacterium]
MKKYSLISSFFLATTCIVSPAALEAKKLLLDNDKDIARVENVGRSKFVEDKAQQWADAARLSDKGDLQTDTSPILRRRFFTTGDGDCFFWSTDLTRQGAVELLLRNSGNINIRRLVQEEIYDALMDDVVGERNLRQQINRARELLGPNDPLQGEINTAGLKDAKDLLQSTIEKKKLGNVVVINEVGYRPLPQAMQQNLLYKDFKSFLHNLQDCIDEAPLGTESRRDLIRSKDQLDLTIKNEYCLSEAIYREYVQHALSRQDQLLLYPQDVGGNARTYFVDALAHLSNKNLVIFAYNDNRTSLVKAHEFITSPLVETWEVLHEEAHYTRVVPIDKQAELAQGINKENEYLAAYKERTKKVFKSKIKLNIDQMQYDHSKNILGSPSFSQNEKDAQKKLIEGLKKSLELIPPSLRMDARVKAAYYKALMNFEVKKAEPIQAKILQIETVSPTLAKNLPGLRSELSQLAGKIEFYNNIIKELKVEPTNEEVADVLLQLSLHYDNVAEEAKAKKAENLTDLEKKNFMAVEKEALALKLKFGDAFEGLQTRINKDLDFQARLNRDAAEKRLAANLAKNLKLDMGNGTSSLFADDYTAAKAVVDIHFAAIRRATPNAKYMNPAYLSADPFLGVDEEDINLTYPNNISVPEWNRTLLSLGESILYNLVPETEHAYVSNNIHTLIQDVNINGQNLRNSFSKITYRADGTCMGEQHGVACTGDARHVKDLFTQSLRLVETYQYFITLNGRRIRLVDENQVTGVGFAKQALMEAFINISGVLSRLTVYPNDPLADQKNLGMKRVKRIIAKYEAMAALEAEEEMSNSPDLTPAKIQGRVQAALIFAQNVGRCIDGVSQALDQIEDSLANKSNFVEADISNIFSSYALSFCEKFANFGGNGDHEWKTSAPQFAKQRTFFSLPHKGAPRTKFYVLNGAVRGERNGLFAPANLMNLFLKGGNVQYDGKNIAFEKFDHVKQTDLVYDAYKRGLALRPVGKVLTTPSIQGLIERDPYLFRIYDEFFEDLWDGEDEPRHSEFFGDREKGEDQFKRPFFEFLLEKFGYIINPERPREQFVAEQAEESKKRLEKLIADGKALLIHHGQLEHIKDEREIQNLINHVYNYHLRNEVEQLVNLSGEQVRQVLEKATSLVHKGMYQQPDTLPLIHAWEAVTGKGWTHGISTQSLLANVYNYHVGKEVKQLVNLSVEQVKQVLEKATSLVHKGMYEQPNTLPLIHACEAVTGKGWTHEISTQGLLANVYNYHVGKEVKQLVNLKEGEKRQVLEKATSLVHKGMYEKPDTLPIIHAWEAVTGKGWTHGISTQGLLVNVYNYHVGKEVKQLVNLKEGEKRQVLEKATSLVLKGTYKQPDTSPLISAWEMIMKKSWADNNKED